MTDPLPPASDAPIAPRRAAGMLALLVAGFLAFCVGAMLLPHARYIRFQQLATSSMRPAVWIYERTQFDRTPIDIAIIGASRTESGISAPALQAALDPYFAARLGRPVHVANLAMPQDGRDLQYVITRQLLETHPEVKLIVYSVTEHASRTGHPAFRSLADVGDVFAAPMIFNPSYLSGIAYLPFRQASLFLQTQAPGLFGVHRTFDPARYWGTDHDTTASFRASTGRWVDRDSIQPAAELIAASRKQVAIRTRVFLPPAARDYEYAIERRYTRAIAAATRANGTRIGFVYLPIFNHATAVADLPFYRAQGFVVGAGFLAADYRFYADYAHLNRTGSARATAWLADRIVAIDRAGPPLIPPAKDAR